MGLTKSGATFASALRRAFVVAVAASAVAAVVVVSLVVRRILRPVDRIRYATRRLAEGKTPREIHRCLKRHLARRLYKLLEHTP